MDVLKGVRLQHTYIGGMGRKRHQTPANTILLYYSYRLAILFSKVKTQSNKLWHNIANKIVMLTEKSEQSKVKNFF